jgi:uncharacterized membrane-anchored protein YitT (DUF2179 family)
MCINAPRGPLRKLAGMIGSGLRQRMADDRASPHAGVFSHTAFEDVQGLVTGTLFCSLGILLMKSAGLVTGGTVGLAFLAHYATGWPLGPLLFLVNAPFYGLAWTRMGRTFTLKTLGCVALLAILSEAMPRWISVSSVAPAFAAIAGGLLLGAGMLFTFRHGASFGGLTVLGLWCQERFGWRAGVVQGAIDVGILLGSWPFLQADQLVLSVVGALSLNFALAVNHKPARSRGT